jgi:hypothetical protein
MRRTPSRNGRAAEKVRPRTGSVTNPDDLIQSEAKAVLARRQNFRDNKFFKRHSF